MRTAHRLVVVESPNKIAKVSKCLGPGFVVVATLGHFRDLPDGELGVDVETWTPKYVPLPGKGSVLSKLREAARGASEVLLGTDADREGEAIAWHVSQALGLRGAKRLRFQELTPTALKRAVAGAGPLDQHLVDAQQARRVLDRLVGYQVSPLLTQFGPSHSAGRVQSATLHLVVERERAREAFRPVAFWTVRVTYEGFSSQAARQDAKGGWAPCRFESAAEATRCLELARKSPHRVEAIDTQPAERKPKAPFTTSTLQQAASAQLGLKPSETMALAQALFEKGAITYHRTDSVTLSDEAIQMARAWLGQHHPKALSPEPVRYRNSDAAQEAHEAIRPTALRLEAETVLSEAEETLFSLISRRFLASQCAPARLDVTSVRTAAGEARFIARGVVVRFPSFLEFLAEDESSIAAKHELQDEAEESQLPPLRLQQELAVQRAESKEDKTKPPPRFTQATLTREMERSGIGRPSTYAATVSTLFERRYLAEEGRAVYPTPRGRLADGAVSAAFPEVVETRYTADLEKQLDDVAAGRRGWKATLTAWHAGFAKKLAAAPAELQRFAKEHQQLLATVDEAAKPTGKSCPKCGKALLLRAGSKGPFLSCSGWPQCDHRADPSERPSTLPCPKCGGKMVELDGKFGRYARCEKRECDGRQDLSAATNEKCPRCGKDLRNRGAFLGCSGYPACNFTVEAKALAHARKTGTSCPKCGSLMVQRKGSKGVFLACLGYPTCRHTAEVPSKRKERGHA